MRNLLRGLAMVLVAGALGVGVALPAADAASKVVATGTFIYPEPGNPDGGEGSVSVRDDAVTLESDFKVTPGPDLQVYLVANPKVRTSQDVLDAKRLNLGVLKSPNGGQSYPVPAGTNLADYSSVVIWCETYSVLFSPADLTFK